LNIHLKALGCRLNEAELENWATEFQRAGHQLVNDADQADLTVLNTCAVTREAVRKSRKLINRVRRENPQGKIVVSGCLVSTGESGDATDLGVDLLVDNKCKDQLVSEVAKRFTIPIMPEGATLPNESALFKRNRQRAFIKVQDGCRYRCSYCIVTVARGDEKSTPVAELVEQINNLSKRGIQEAVLTGVHVGGYGSDIGSSLHELVTTLLAETSIPRLRFASVEPWDLGENFFQLFENPRLMPHMHLPIQSGSSSVLRRMSRRCNSVQFADLVRQARTAIPSFNITTDIIVGFPAETTHEWQETLEFVEQTGFGHIHIFSFSPREGTKAAAMSEQISPEVKQRRSRELHALAAVKKREFLETQLGTTAQVLCEGAGNNDRLFGYTENYTRVEVLGANPDTGPNSIRRVRLGSVDTGDNHIICTLV